MFYSDLVKKASEICFEAHKHDRDKAGYPYFMHPMTLAVQFDDEATVCTALLHDVIEDHADRYSFEYLKNLCLNGIKNLYTEDKLTTSLYDRLQYELDVKHQILHIYILLCLLF